MPSTSLLGHAPRTLVAAALVLAGCGAPDDDAAEPPVTDPDDTTTTSTATTTTVAEPTTTTVPEPTTATVPEPTTTAVPPERRGPDPVGAPRTEPLESAEFPTVGRQLALLHAVDTAIHDGFERVVLRFEGSEAPSYRVQQVDPPILEDGSGREIEVAGNAFLELRLTPASGVDLRRQDPVETYDGPHRIEAAGAIREIVRVGDFEANLAWVLGLDAARPFAVAVFEDPLRFVVDVFTD